MEATAHKEASHVHYADNYSFAWNIACWEIEAQGHNNTVPTQMAFLTQLFEFKFVG